MSESDAPSLWRLIAIAAAFVIIGSFLVAYLWETANQLLAGHFDSRMVVLAIPVAAVLAGLLVLLARTLRRMNGERDPRARAT